ncbi:MAG: hypothetical protein SWX82_08510 [Cyanobacteriota bacterium]|nr:hypothetical protein [Cyanobacteriota bacterium]
MTQRKFFSFFSMNGEALNLNCSVIINYPLSIIHYQLLNSPPLPYSPAQ